MITSIPYAIVALALVAALYDLGKRLIGSLPSLPTTLKLTARCDQVMAANVNLATETKRALEQAEARLQAVETRVNNLAARGAIVGAQKNRNQTERL